MAAAPHPVRSRGDPRFRNSKNSPQKAYQRRHITRNRRAHECAGRQCVTAHRMAMSAASRNRPVQVRTDSGRAPAQSWCAADRRARRDTDSQAAPAWEYLEPRRGSFRSRYEPGLPLRHSYRSAFQQSVANHPRALAGKPLGSVGASHGGLGFFRTAAAASRRMPGRLIFRARARRMRRALVGGMGRAGMRGHRRQRRRRQDGAPRDALARRAAATGIPLVDRAQHGKAAAMVTEIVVDRHARTSWEGGCGSRHAREPPRFRQSSDRGRSTPPAMCRIGPAAVGLMSNSKISVGSQSVAQAFGMSTTPLMCPCTGAVPRIEYA